MEFTSFEMLLTSLDHDMLLKNAKVAIAKPPLSPDQICQRWPHMHAEPCHDMAHPHAMLSVSKLTGNKPPLSLIYKRQNWPYMQRAHCRKLARLYGHKG